LAKSDIITLRTLGTDKFLAESKNIIPEKQPGIKVNWDAMFVKPKLKALQYVMIPKTDIEAAQITVHFSTKQALWFQNKKGEIVAGSKDYVDIEEFLVLERMLLRGYHSEWKICAKLDSAK